MPTPINPVGTTNPTAVGVGTNDTPAPVVTPGQTGTSGVTNNSGGPAEPDAFGGPAAVDLAPQFGTSRAAVPNLLSDWHDATVNASVRERAIASFQHLIDDAVSQAEDQIGRELDRRERGMLVGPIIKANLPAARARFAPQMTTTAEQREQTVDDALARYRPIIARKKDPFTPITQGDPVARANEVVLWENKNAVVIIDAFCPSPKALVIPKKQVSFAVDLPAAALKELAQIASVVGDVMSTVGRSAGTPDIWINPPQAISVKQLHVHVQPHMPRWDALELDDAAIAQRQTLLYAQVTGVLSKRLGKPTP